MQLWASTRSVCERRVLWTPAMQASTRREVGERLEKSPHSSLPHSASRHVKSTGAPRCWASRTGSKLCNKQQSHSIPPTPSSHLFASHSVHPPIQPAPRTAPPIPLTLTLPWHSATYHATPSPSVHRPRTVRSPSSWSSSRTRRARAGRGRRGMRGSLRGGKGRRIRRSYMVSPATVRGSRGYQIGAGDDQLIREVQPRLNVGEFGGIGSSKNRNQVDD
jgi:hypothetical protein